MRRRGFIAGISAAVAFHAMAVAQSLPPAPVGVQTMIREGVEFSVIDSPNAPPAAFTSDLRPSWYPVQGRGSVPYAFGLARTEVTTAQWMEFANTFSTLGGSYTQFAQPTRWGARLDPTYTGPGWRWELSPDRPQAAQVPVWGINWREAAMYCNWLHNGRISDPASLTHGAYNTSTFGYPDDNFNNGFTDQITRSPNARFWIPSLDEWMLGAFYDPVQHRWWLSHYGLDTTPVYGFPGDPGATSSGGLPVDPEGAVYGIPLGAYGVQSPFGLLSTSGGPNEWLENAVGLVSWTGLPVYRYFYLGSRSDSELDINGDTIFSLGTAGDIPSGSAGLTIRIATSVPSPSTGLMLAAITLTFHRRRCS